MTSDYNQDLSMNVVRMPKISTSDRRGAPSSLSELVVSCQLMNLSVEDLTRLLTACYYSISDFRINM